MWLSVLALPIFPGRRQPSIVGRNELNYRVRNGNGWTLALISTNFVVAKSACLCFRLRRKLRPLPCSSSSSRTRFTGLRSEGDTTLCYPVLPENKLYYIVFGSPCQALFTIPLSHQTVNQRSVCGLERKSSGGNKLSASAGSERSGACFDVVTRTGFEPMLTA